MRRVAFGLAALLCALTCGITSAYAFTEPATYFGDPSRGGGGGRWFTGSPAEGYGCAVCHVDAIDVPVSVEGLPAEGYVPGQRYDVRIAWPEFAAFAETERAQSGGAPLPMAVVAELVGETGEGSGTIEVASTEHAQPGELCIPPLNEQAAQLFWVPPGQRTEEAGIQCEANALGQRCIAATRSCGASELRFQWTAPQAAQDTIWFAAGFVASDRVSGDPLGDRVREIKIPIQPAASAKARYETALSGGCSVRRGVQSRGPAFAFALVLGCIVLWRQRRRA